MHGFSSPVLVTGAGAACALGIDLPACLEARRTGKVGLRPLGELDAGLPGKLHGLPAGWLPDRAYLKGRRYGAASNAAVQVAREAIAAAGWDAAACHDAWLWVGTSRGNAGELTGAWKSRRPVRKFAASNSMHSETAAAISLQLGVHGPWQVVSNGCAAGLDALGQAAIAVALGWTARALVVAVDLPLVSSLLEDFSSTGLLSTNGVNDPYAPDTSGFFPAEGAAALVLEATPGPGRAWCRLAAYAANSDAHDAIGLPPDGLPLAGMIAKLLGAAGPAGMPVALCPHATGTAAHRISESAALARAIPGTSPALHLLKPFTGHTLGASGLLDSVFLAAALRDRLLPANLPALWPPVPGWAVPDHPLPLAAPCTALKIAAGMGGHNAGILFESSRD